MEPKAVIFDLDGTLIDSLVDIALCCNYVLNEYGYPTHDIDKYNEFVGDGAYVLIRNALPKKSSDDEITKTLTHFKKVYEQNIYSNTKAYIGIDGTLEALKAKKIPAAILSNKPHEFTIKYAESIFSNYKFAMVLGQRDGVPIKPDPLSALEIAEHLKLKPSSVFFIGDTATDIKTAKNAGMKSIGVLWGFRDMEELESAGADFIIKTPEDIIDIVMRG